MEASEALALIRDAVPNGPGAWADLGAGSGTFTRALAELLGSGSRIYAVDRDRRALGSIARWAKTADAEVITVVADIAGSFDLPGVCSEGLDGLLLANALHFFEDAGAVLATLVRRLQPGGRVVLIEYDRRRANPWVPHPIAAAQLPALAARAGLTGFRITARQASAFGGELYVAVATRPGKPTVE